MKEPDSIYDADIDWLRSWAKGHILISIGEGCYRNAVNMIVEAAYSSGAKHGKRSLLAEQQKTANTKIHGND